MTKLELLKDLNVALAGRLGSCDICPRRCCVDRTLGMTGYCRAGYEPTVYSYSPHHGEEPPISGRRGSGTIFFSHCNMKCAYCQNYQFSQLDKGKRTGIDELAGIMLGLQGSGCHNINLVNPTHYLVQIMLALEKAVSLGLTVPIVYNTSGYDSPDMIRMLDGIIDIYLPDMRYSDNAMASRYSDAPDYVETDRAAVKEMSTQVGGLVTDEAGVAVRGLIIRLLVLPNGISGTVDSLGFIRESIGAQASLSIMSQYYPAFRGSECAEISRPVTPDEYKNVVDAARGLGLNNGWVQDAPENIDPRFYGTNITPKG
jgi:putative pyruvate formate lyase activating enzyme